MLLNSLEREGGGSGKSGLSCALRNRRLRRSGGRGGPFSKTAVSDRSSLCGLTSTSYHTIDDQELIQLPNLSGNIGKHKISVAF